MNKCSKCGTPIDQEYGRCVSCTLDHKKLCEQLDAKPKMQVERKPVEWVKSEQVKNGVVVTTYMTREEAQLMGRA